MIERIARLNPEEVADYLQELIGLFEDMESAYRRVAGHYGFECTGCQDNCCLSLFYHHTVLEYLLLKQGFLALDSAEQDEIRQKARQVTASQTKAEHTGRLVKAMCPLNHKGLCRTYHHRPMICRMHGIPNELHRPGQLPVQGPGCGEFEKKYGAISTLRIDRTPFYKDLAGLERRLRSAHRLKEKLKMTVARMITTF